MKTLMNWCIVNGIEVNKKKSGVMLLYNETQEKEILGFPIVDNYKYLGVTINYKMKCPLHLYKTKTKLNQYITRNKKLLHKYFSPRSLLKIFNYYQKSRLCYAMCCFLDQDEILTRLETNFMVLLKNILRLGSSCNHNRIHATLGLPNLRIKLAVQLLKCLEKNQRLLHVETKMYDISLQKYIGKIIGGERLNDLRTKTLVDDPELPQKWKLIEEELLSASVRDSGNKIGVVIKEEFPRIIYKEWYRYYDRRDCLVLKFFCNKGFFRDTKERCQHCRGDNSRSHAVNICQHYDHLRIEAEERIRNQIWREEFEIKNLEEIMNIIYFCPSEDKSMRRKEMEILKFIISSLYMKQHKLDKKGHSLQPEECEWEVLPLS
jgi:hypothetical protein